VERGRGRGRGRGGEQRELLARLRRDAERIALRFELTVRSIEAEHPRVKRRYGVCYSDGSIRIRLQHASTGLPLKYSSLVNTLCHELAHLRHFNHGPRFRAFYERILDFARFEGIYQPGPVASPEPAPRTAPVSARVTLTARPPPGAAPARPVQLTLFG